MKQRDFIDQIYEAAADPSQWTVFGDSLSARLGGAAWVLYDRPSVQSKRSLGVNAVRGYSDSDRAAMQAHFRHIDIRVRNISHVAEGYVHFDDRNIPFKDIERTEIHTDFYRPKGVGHVCGVLLARGTDELSILSVHRDAKHGPFSQVEQSLVDHLAPHLVRAWRITKKVRQYEVDIGALTATIDASGICVFLVSSDGTIRHMSPPAEALLRAGRQLRSSQGRLVATDPRNDAALRTMLGRAAARPRTDAPPITLHGEQPITLMALLQNGPTDAPLIVLANDPFAARLPDPRLLVAQFGLTAAEARVARALTEGLDAPELARRFNVSVETVRSQIKRACAKCGVSSQAALVALLLRSLAVIGCK